MRLEIRGTGIRTGAELSAPHSKSMAHRLLICAGLADGVSTVKAVDISEDILATVNCLKTLGAGITAVTDEGHQSEDVKIGQNVTLTVRGISRGSMRGSVLQCRESGSTLRFIAPLATLSGREITLTGSRTLMSRPMSVYDKIFAEKGLRMEHMEEALLVSGRLPAGTYKLRGDISSQFISGLLFALPLLYGDSRIVIEGRVESRPYIDMTIEALGQFGVWAGWEQDGQVISVPGGQSYTPQEVTVEGDWSGASYLFALGAGVSGLNAYSSQGDKACVDYFRQLDEEAATLDITDTPDLGPVLAAYAALRKGCTLTGTKRLSFKESDRSAAMQEELAKFGVDTEIAENSMTIGCGVKTPSEILKGHNDHRIVMALVVICAQTGGIIDGAEAVSKSFPDFFDKLQSIGICVREVI